MTTPPRLASEAGYSLVELLVSTAIMLAVTGGIFSLVSPAQGTSQAQPEVSDMQQRMRVAADSIFKELMMAGAGPYQGPVTGSLIQYFPPIVPRRMGMITPDAKEVFRNDAITVSYIPNTYSQTTISQAMPPQSAELKVTPQTNCPADSQNLCGFKTGMVVIIFDTSGNSDYFTITNVQNAAAHLQHRGTGLNTRYEAGSSVTQIVSNTYYRDASTRQLKRYDGSNGTVSDLPLVDNLVDLRFEYFGDPNPPTTPRPIASGTANCLYSAAGAVTLPVLPADEGSLVKLDGATAQTSLTNGPWCGSGQTQFDADLLRVRKVRVMLRMQVAKDTLRGRDTLLFANPGKSQGGALLVPDYFVRYEVTPRNLNLTR